ncbi:MAG: hypothetical protein C0524_03135 [Rhodobacter sp.]|nr:hypothetical protein [Rhodobacter sp.]
MRAVWAGVLLGLAAFGSAAVPQALWINEIPHADALALEPVVEDFESLANQRFDRPFRIKGADVSQMLAGQTLRYRTGRGGDRHWVLDARAPQVPLALDQTPGESFAAVVRDEAFAGRQALAGIGPPQVAGRARLGSGIVTVLFDEPQCLFGLRTALDGGQENTVMRDQPEGNLNLIFWRRDGDKIGEFRRFTDQGLVELAYIQSSGGEAQILAVTIQNLDPGGIGIDEILFSPLCPMMVSDLR